jgi:hypothetical protein
MRSKKKKRMLCKLPFLKKIIIITVCEKEKERAGKNKLYGHRNFIA